VRVSDKVRAGPRGSGRARVVEFSLLRASDLTFSTGDILAEGEDRSAAGRQDLVVSARAPGSTSPAERHDVIVAVVRRPRLTDRLHTATYIRPL